MTRGGGQVHEAGCTGSTALLILAPRLNAACHSSSGFSLRTLARNAFTTGSGSVKFAGHARPLNSSGAPLGKG